MELGIASVAAITAIAYLLGMAVKATEAADKWIPIICGATGLVLGVVAWAMGVPDFLAQRCRRRHRVRLGGNGT